MAQPEAPMSAFGPDFTFAFDDWLGHRGGLGSIPENHHGTEVAVIGGGIGGLVTAYELLRLGLTPVVYEAGRLGGRLRSEPFAAAPHVIAELGGMRFPVSGRAFFHYADLVDIETVPFPNPLTPAAPTTVIDLAGEQHYAETDADLPPLFREIAHAWETALEEEVGIGELKEAILRRDAAAVKARWNPLVSAWDGRTFYDFVATSKAFADLTFRHREVFGQVGFGTGGWDSDFANSMLEVFRVVINEFESEQRLVVGGAEQLPRRLWDHAPESITHWSPGTSLSSLHGGAHRPGVARIERAPDGSLRITDRDAGVNDFPAAVVAMQSWLLTTNLEVEESLFSQPVWMALDRTRYMQSSKTFVMVDRPFWHDVDRVTGRATMSMTLTDRNTRGTYLFDNGPDEPAVICLSYAWNSDAMKVLAKSAVERAELALDTLETIYPNVDIRSHVVGEPITVSWEADPNFLGAFKGALPGHYRYSQRMYGHFVQRDLPAAQRGIFLAGDDISFTPGWAEGAVQTALNAVWGVMHHFGGQCPPDNPGPGDAYPEWGPIELDD
jgi:tryptophan 2-monooxygenase